VIASLADGEPEAVKKQIVRLATGCRHSFEWLQLEAARRTTCSKVAQSPANACRTRPGLYATEVNIQNFNFVQAPVLKFVQPLVHMGAVLAREPDVTDPLRLILPPLAATMDDCCRIAEMLPAPCGQSSTGRRCGIVG
jgi:hypothetical protein